MVAGINGASNSPANKKKTTDVAWMPAPPQKKKKKEKNAIEHAIDHKERLEKLINEM